MKTPCFIARKTAVALAFSVLAPLGLAQSSGAAGAPPTGGSAPAAGSSGNDSNGNEVVTLQAFEVSGDEAHGYIAAESTTGTRIASKLSDLPFDVDVVTAPFLRDFAAFGLNQQLALVSGFSPSEVTGQYQLRGFSSQVQMVDGFRHIGLIDVVDVDRIEVIKGPDASI
jgi:outer membrane receptor protein involved in Fe transport